MRKAALITAVLLCVAPITASAQIPLVFGGDIAPRLAVEAVDSDTMRLKQAIARIVSTREADLKARQRTQIQLSILTILIVGCGRVVFDHYRRHRLPRL